MLLALLPLAEAGCPTEDAGLSLGEHAWYLPGGAWEVGPTTYSLGSGFLFDAVRDGSPVGLVYVGKGTLAARPDPVDAAGLATALAVELEGASLVRDGQWNADVDTVWALGAVSRLPPEARALEVERGQIFDVSQPEPELLVFGDRAFAEALVTARETVSHRPASLADAGYPLASVLATADRDWGLVEAHTSLPIGRLAGRVGTNGTAPDEWVTTLVDDPALGTGRRFATLTMGTRYVEPGGT